MGVRVDPSVCGRMLMKGGGGGLVKEDITRGAAGVWTTLLLPFP